jgi:tetratricopeptide (TPR) repeat protein
MKIRRFGLALLGLSLSAAFGAESDPAREAVEKGVSYSDKGDLDSAIAAFTEAIRLDAKYAEAYGNRGAAYGTKGEFDKALADFMEAIRLNPKYAEAYWARGLAYGEKGDKSKADEDFAQAKKLGYEPK